MNREVHVQFWERVGVKLPGATHLPFVVYSKRYAIRTLRRRNPSNLIADLRERCGNKANRADQPNGFQHEEYS